MSNRNSETYFSNVPTIEMARSTFDLSHESITTFNIGDVIPLTKPIEVYPGDTFEVGHSSAIRLQTLMHPIFGNIVFDVYAFFEPNRLVQDNWPGVMGENLTGAWAPQIEYTTPMIQSTSDGFASGSIMDHYGLPIGIPLKVNALPIRGYHDIWNNYFRDQNLQDPLNIYKGDATKYSPSLDDLAETNPIPRKAARLHDYFSSCQPAPLKAQNPVNIPMSGQLPVITTTDQHNQETPVGAYWTNGAESDIVNGFTKGVIDGNNIVGRTGILDGTLYPTNLWAKVLPGVGDDVQGLTATISDLRTAFQISRMLERDAIGGSRYRELILSHFSCSTGDARMQIPEYLGGNRITLNISQVVNSSESESYSLGNVGGMSHTVDVHGDFVKSFVEHGYLHILGVARFYNVYATGVDRLWSRSDRFSYYWPSLAFIGAQAVKNRELYAQGISAVGNPDDEVFGYQEAWADLRQIQNQVSGLMRPQASGTLASWNLADDYEELPTLSAGWIESNKETVDRTLAVTSEVSDQILADFWFDIKATRVMPMFSVPGLVDHF